jgi:peptidoglycan biosynthesis protein MviN/MurJ (putative lipid II flippase)
MAIAAGNVVVNAGTDIAFLHLFGIKGIALSTSLVYLLSASAVYGTASRALRTRERTDARG